jgi:dienelactone hydrolase
MARDADYAVAVLDAWRTEERESGRTWSAEARPVTYYVTEGNENVPLAGTVVRRQGSSTETVPGILLFHTAAGPHDVFLLWKAASLVNSVDAVVLIADVLSDESGWGWDSDRSRYTEARNLLLEAGHGGRPVLQGRVQAAVDTLIAQDDVDSSKLAALGWCLGGHSILELGRMHTEGMRAMVTFHGVFGDDTGQLPNGEGVDPSSPSVEILICSGVQDPFVPSEDLEQALELFQRHGHRVSLLQLRDAKHGFTNPAQEFNENKEAFAFHKESADKAWRQTLALLKRTIASS